MVERRRVAREAAALVPPDRVGGGAEPYVGVLDEAPATAGVAAPDLDLGAHELDPLFASEVGEHHLGELVLGHVACAREDQRPAGLRAGLPALVVEQLGVVAGFVGRCAGAAAEQDQSDEDARS